MNRIGGARARRAGRARAVVALLVVLLPLAGCGTIPAQPSTGGRTSHAPRATTTPASTSPTSRAPGGSTPAVTSSASAPPTGPGPTTGAPTTSAPTTSPPTRSSTSSSGSWVGHFHGQAVRVPYGHGATMSFTFDDGPWPGSTSQVLALLEQHHVHAVFCLIGNQAQAQPALVRSEVAAGHELCDHSRDHDLFMRRHPQAYVDAEVADGLAEVRRAAPRGTRVRFYRQPGGTWSPAVVRAMKKQHLDPLRWSDDPRDWSRPGSAVIVQRVVAGLRPGAVVLMHDGGGDRSQSVEALRFLLHAVLAAGWRPVLAPHVTLSDKAAAKVQ